MAYDDVPTDLFSGMSEDGTTLSIPIASIPQLTAAEADATTGDARKIVYAILRQVFDYYDGLATADKPARMTVTRQKAYSGGTDTETFIVAFQTDVSGIDVADE